MPFNNRKIRRQKEKRMTSADAQQQQQHIDDIYLYFAQKIDLYSVLVRCVMSIWEIYIMYNISLLELCSVVWDLFCTNTVPI